MGETRGRKPTLIVTLTEDDRTILRRWVRKTTMAAGPVQRARLLLLLDAGERLSAVGRKVGLTRNHVYKWVARYHESGVNGLLNPTRARKDTG